MTFFKFSRVLIESTAYHLPDEELSSLTLEDRLSALYQRLEIPIGTLEKISGIRSRRMWPAGTMPSFMATEAAKKAIAKSGVSPDDFGMVVNCSVTRDFFEPATGVIVHKNLKLKPHCMALDVTNACIGFSNGILFAANMIESGVIKAALIVTAETVGSIINATLADLQKNTTIDRTNLLKVLPTFTLGCGAAAYVICDERYAKQGQRLIGSVSATASDHSELCSGNGNFHMSQVGEALNPLMYTESAKLMNAASQMGGQMMGVFTETFGWKPQDVQHVFCHQVGRQVNEAFYKPMNLDIRKEFTIFQDLGNMVSASLPICFAKGIEEKGMQSGEKALLTAYGSGLNSIFTGVEI